MAGTKTTTTKKQEARSKKQATKLVMVEVEALITPVITDKAKLAKGGRAPMDQATAELKAKSSEVTIIRVLD